MASQTWIQNNFNGGQVTSKLDGRSDIPQYNKGCKVLHNLYVQSQGGVQSRVGTKYMTEAVDDSRLIPFQFSRDESYVFEISPTSIRVFDDTGLVDTIASPPWTASEIQNLKYDQVGDKVYLVCSTETPYILTRLTSTPSFSLEPIAYDYPPLLEENTDTGHNMKVLEAGGVYTLVSDVADTFHAIDIGKQFSLELPRDPLTITVNFSNGASTEVLDVSFSKWKVTTGGTWNGRVTIQRKLGSTGIWEDYVVLGDTRSINADNFTFSSTEIEGKDVEIRLFYVKQSNNIKATIIALSPQQSSVVTITGITSDLIAVVDPMTYIGSLDKDTNHWSEGAFGVERGFPSAVIFHENRLCFCGTETEPSTVYMSESDNFMTFKLGDYATSSLKVKPITNEPATWMISKGDLMLGTRGSVITVQATDKKALSFNNLSAVESNAFGGSYIQAVKTNETVVYIEAGSTKLREIFYSDEEQSIISRDLTILADDIGGIGGFKNLTLQKIPDQVVWGLRSDGLIAGLTYERSQDIYGWHVHDFGGSVSSLAVRQNALIDELWIIVNRDGVNMIEYSGTRVFADDLLDTWFVDSGVKSVLLPTTEITTITGYMDDQSEYLFGFSLVDHGLSDGDIINFVDASDDLYNLLGDNEYIVDEIDANYFNIKYNNTTTPVNPLTILNPEYFDLTCVDESGIGGRYTKYAEGDWRRPHTGDNYLRMIKDNSNWTVFIVDVTGEYPVSNIMISSSDGDNPTNPLLPVDTGWVSVSHGPTTVTIEYLDDEVYTGSFKQVLNNWDGLDHLDGKNVQVVGDGSYIGTFPVVNGEVELTAYYNQTVIGLRFLKIVQPMLIESKNYNTFSAKKINLNSTIRFRRSFGGYSGVIVQTRDEMDILPLDTINSTFPIIDGITTDQYPITLRQLSDPIGEHVGVWSGDKDVGYNDKWGVLKTVYIIGDLPMPFEILGIGVQLGG